MATTADKTNPVISLKDVSIRYDTSDRWIGDQIDLDIYPGETVLLLGPSGCGKSTVMLALAGLIPTSLEADLRGRVLCGGINTRHVDAGQLAGKVGIVFQDPDAQVVTGSLLDEVCFGLENLLAPVDEIETRALTALRRMGLADSREEALRTPTELSGGGRQRLAIACALALDPPVLVLDEPTANLDPVASAEFYAALTTLKDASRAIVLVEHELDDALQLADRVVVLDGNGTIIHDGAPAEVLGRHARDLSERGIWLPTATGVALRLGLDADPERELPLTVSELAPALDAVEAPEGTIVSTTDPGRSRDQVLAQQDVLIDVHAASVRLGGVTVLHGVDLRIMSGEFLAIAGINGAGKSTLTRAIAGLVPLSSGSIALAGTPLTALDVRQVGDRIGYVFQNPEHQFLARTARDELAYGLRVRRRPKHEVDDRVDRMLARFELARYADVNPFLLSHGEKRRLSVATALITEPKILILDEPTFGQDQARAREIVNMICELNATGITIIIITHDLQLIADYADRVTLLSQGRLLDVGATGEILCDTRLIERAGLRPPPVRHIALALAREKPEWRTVYRTGQIREIAP
ncbi:ATP-binding cassette domain-containing protein [Shinella sp. CPCC 100929]|uniref:ATP-binding cassette domain-containing protein n=1 Tax=Shinella lacus TaxID=2654216 RepID=A0ABT1R807_9HYPH|nr:ATP-binding cassette domain-containing protein [Shinella lacus]